MKWSTRSLPCLPGVQGDLGVVVCGPAGMADDVRLAVGELGPKARRGVIFVDEAFSW